jgi:HrpA-like RNA helicase
MGCVWDGCLQIHEEEKPGDVLVFLPGQEDIEAVADLLRESDKSLAKTWSHGEAVHDMVPSGLGRSRWAF